MSCGGGDYAWTLDMYAVADKPIPNQILITDISEKTDITKVTDIIDIQTVKCTGCFLTSNVDKRSHILTHTVTDFTE